MQTKTAMYDSPSAAEAARNELLARGFADSDISIRGTDTAPSSTTGSEDKGFWASLADLFMPDDDRDTYAEGIRRGGYLLSVRVPEGMEDEAEDVLEAADPVDLDQRAESWRQEGWSSQGMTSSGGTYAAAGMEAPATGYSTQSGTASMGTAGYTDTSSTTTGQLGTARAAGTTTGDTDETLQVVEEDLRVGKREVAGGRVRVRTYVTERPVEEDVNLRSERVTIERRPVDRDVAPGAAAFQERTIEAVERGEEAVVSKTAHVKEEIAIRKDVETHTETVHDTVRSTEVEVDDDRTGLAGTDPALRRDRDGI
jgi:uncharacterized protein (TIGR02271 family)